MKYTVILEEESEATFVTLEAATPVQAAAMALLSSIRALREEAETYGSADELGNVTIPEDDEGYELIDYTFAEYVSHTDGIAEVLGVFTGTNLLISEQD